jgi:hypothetical protein
LTLSFGRREANRRGYFFFAGARFFLVAPVAIGRTMRGFLG